MSYKSIFPISAVIFISIVLYSNICFAQDGEAEYSNLFSSERINQWNITGLVIPDTSDGLSFVFPYDENAALAGVPDTVYLEMTGRINLSRCSTAYIRYNKKSHIPNSDSWIISNVYIYARHEFNHNWVRVFENISDLTGRVHELSLQFRIVVKTDHVYPATLTLYDIKVEGTCGS